MSSRYPAKVDRFIRQAERFHRKQRFHKKAIRVLAEGDSWFSTPLDLDRGASLPFRINDGDSFNVISVADPGATLSAMISEANEDWVISTRPLAEWTRDVDYDVVIFSGGGNDIAGEEMLRYLDPASDPALDAVTWPGKLEVMRRQITLLHAYLGELVPGAPIVMHGYDYALPSGRSYPVLWGLLNAGPWLKPHLEAAGVTDPKRQIRTVNQLIDDYNDALSDLARHHLERLYHLDLRNTLKNSDWANEMHPTDAGAERIANKYRKAIRSVAGRKRKSKVIRYD